MESSELFHDRKDPRASPAFSLITDRPHFPSVTWKHSDLSSVALRTHRLSPPTSYSHSSFLFPLDQRDPCLRGHAMSICCALAKHLLNSMMCIPSHPKSVLCLRSPALGDQGLWVPCLHHWIIRIQHRI